MWDLQNDKTILLHVCFVNVGVRACVCLKILLCLTKPKWLVLQKMLIFAQWQHVASLRFLVFPLIWHIDLLWHHHYEAGYNSYGATVESGLSDSSVVWMQSEFSFESFSGEHSCRKWYVTQKCLGYNRSEVSTLKSGVQYCWGLFKKKRKMVIHPLEKVSVSVPQKSS